MRNAHDSATGHVSWPGTHSIQCSMHKLMRQSRGNRFDSDCCGLADPAQPVRRSLRGAKHRAAGIARRAFPWRQAKRAAPQARRREGLKPNGRDSEVGTGRSPKARRRFAPTRPSHSEHHAERLVERFNTTHSFMRLPYVRPRRLRVPTHEYERAAPCNTQVLGVLGPSAKRSPRNGRGRPATHEDP